MTAVNERCSLAEKFESLPDDLQLALRKYRSSDTWSGGHSFAYDLNKLLRSGSELSSEAQSWLELLDKAIASAGTLTQPMTVYRGVADIDHISNLASGGKWQSSSYLSTSWREDNLHTHIVPDFDGRVCGVLTIDLPVDTQVAFLGSTADSAHEGEILLGRNHEFEIVSVADGQLDRLVRADLCRKFSGLKLVRLKLTK